MPRKKSSRPTDGELEILRVLWQRGPSTVRQVHRTLRATKHTTHNTTLKLMLIMHRKGLLTRDESDRPQVYAAAIPEEQMQRHLMADFLQRVFGGSARKLVAAITTADIPAEELAEIRQLLEGLKQTKGKRP